MAAPATVSGEPCVRVGHWETGKAGREALTRKPGDLPAQVTQPVGGAHHTERLFAAVTQEPMRGAVRDVLTTSEVLEEPVGDLLM